MNYWKKIWNAYHENATLGQLFKDVFTLSTRWDKTILLFFTLIFLLGMYLLFISSGGVEVPVVGVGVLGLVYQILKLKKGFVRHEFGNISQLQTPHDDKDHQTTRYLMFKKDLEEENITENHIQDCQELIDLQIDISSSKNSVGKFNGFVSGIFIAILASFGTRLEMEELIYFSISLSIIFGFVYFLLYLIPSKLENLREMKYFMLLYSREFIKK